MVERDELFSELKTAWKKVAAPEPADAREDLDPLTRKSVEWMRAAWAQIEVPEAVLPRRRVLRLLPTLRTGTAAAAVAAAVLFAWRFMPASIPPIHHGTPDALGTATEPSETLARPAVVTSIGNNNIEFRSGPVTLVLVTSDTGG